MESLTKGIAKWKFLNPKIQQWNRKLIEWDQQQNGEDKGKNQ